ncbi:polyketide synthase [Stenotrophomonas pictorum JCM 9942]|uniref:Polyketide synthase n=2 Tax=Stenotrophomonas pictorum TaxID=86184 RepID=A0A0R0AEF4_9GAMM|nr:DsbA family oxidoreductase [Stenotrophomonas pictorum]KRG39320.1 polyketide synthase [Stenotrophomonas pictorum JCM 9942]
MRIDIWSDVVCPWCWIGKHRFQRGLELMGENASSVEVHWHPFLLDPDADATPVPLREAYAAKFGGAERTAQMLAQTQAAARAEGLPMDFEQGQVRVTTLPAHRLLWLAGREGVQEQVGEALFHAHFAQGRNLADPQVLAGAAAAGGISAVRVQQLLDSDEGLAEVRAGLGQAQALGIRSVPTFVINGRYAVQGAQPPEAFAEVLAKVAVERARAVAPGQDEPGCGPDGCSI